MCSCQCGLVWRSFPNAGTDEGAENTVENAEEHEEEAGGAAPSPSDPRHPGLPEPRAAAETAPRTRRRLVGSRGQSHYTSPVVVIQVFYLGCTSVAV